MRKPMLVLPFLIGAGIVILNSDSAWANRGRGGAGGARPGGGGGGARPNPGMNRPAPRPGGPTMSRPNVPRPQPNIQRPQSRPASPRPVSPGQRPNMPNRPSGPITNPGMGGNRPTPPVSRPGQGLNPGNRPNFPVNRPGDNSNLRPGGNTRPDLPVNRPNLPTTRPNLPPIGERPQLPNRPGAGGGGNQRPTFPNRPGTGGGGEQRPIIPDRPGGGGDRPKFPDRPGGGGDLPKFPDRPGGGDRPKFPDRPGGGGDRPKFPDRPGGGGDRPWFPNRPGGGGDIRPPLRPGGGNNTIINNRPINNNLVQVGRPWWGAGNRPWVNNAIYHNHGYWCNNFNHWHGGCHPWYHGYWPGCWNNVWGINVGNAWLNSWAVANSCYGWGYSTYSNPFYVQAAQQPVYINYSQPIQQPAQVAADQPPAQPPPTASESFDAARASFLAGDYRTALTQVERSLQEFPNDPVAHEFRALVLFALGEYRSASAALYAVLAAGPGWDWSTMSSLYADSTTYRQQLTALERAAAAAPDDPALHFLLAYHFTTTAANEEAKKEYELVHKLLPKDEVTTRLLRALAGEEPKAAVAAAPKADTPADLELDITGSWVAKRPDGVAIGLTFTADGKFEWTVGQNGNKNSFGGTFGVEDNMMSLERAAGGVLVGQVKALAKDKFTFQVLGGPEGDPGLTFVKK